VTTSVKVTARCADTIEVYVSVVSEGMKSKEQHTLQNGESVEVYTYDDRVVTVSEVAKGGDPVET